MNEYYFTFGSEGVFSGGWVIVWADSDEEARDKFAEHYGERAYNKYGRLNFCTTYTKEQFMNTIMVNGNRGAFCHEVIH